MGTLILPDFLIDIPGHAPKQGQGVRVAGDRIVEVAPNADLRNRHPFDEVVDGSGCVLSPGFVDAHTHLYGLLAHGIPLHKAPSGFWPFLVDFWWPLVEDRLDREMICAATGWNLAQMLRGGTTCFYDITEAPHALPGCLQAQAEVAQARGIRGLLSFEATERVSSENGQLGLRENLEFIRSRARGQLISGLMCYHTTFTCSADFICQAFEMAAREGVAVHMHASEGTYEPEQALARYGERTFEYYDRLGVAGPSMLASQCVQITPREIEILAERQVRVTHMPLSNCEVGGGIAPIPDMLDAGITVGLGSDGYITDMFEVMRGAFLIHKAHRRDPRVMPASLVWRLATEGGAHALGLEKVGRLAEGWQADLQLIDSALPTPVEPWNLYDQLLLYRSRRDVRDVMVAGQWRVREGVVLGADEEALAGRVRTAAQPLADLKPAQHRQRQEMANLETTLFGVSMPSPFILASGPLSYDATGLWVAYRAGAGGIVTKTLRLEAAINPTPHMVVPRSSNLRATLFNTEKWADLTWQQWVEKELPAMAGHPGALIASIGHTPAEGEAIAGPVAATGVVDAIECVAYTKATIVDLVRVVREQAPDVPILAKLTFNWGDDLYPAAEAALKAGATGFTAIDSIGPTLQVDVETGEPTIGGAGNRAWMSGAAIRPVAQAVVAELALRFPGVPIVGTGGIIQAEDAVEMTMLGASALGVCTGPLLRGLEWFQRTSDKLSAWLDARGYTDLSAVRGKALPNLHAVEDTDRLTFGFDPMLCTKCDLCVLLCPYEAREMGGGDKPKTPGLTQILDEDRCRYCGLCVEVCKPGALSYGNWPRPPAPRSPQGTPS